MSNATVAALGPPAAGSDTLSEGINDPNYQPQPGRLGNLTAPQHHALEELKEELQKDGYFVMERMDDATLLRFLRARKFDVAKTKQMLLNTEKWRKNFGVDQIIKTDREFTFPEKDEVNKYYPQYYHKTDKDGRPIYIEQLGKLDVDALHGITTDERLLKRLVLEYEKFLTDRLPACSKAANHSVETSCTIMDLNNVSLSSFNCVRSYVSAAAKIGQNHYPETMGKFYIINAPWLFSKIWSFVKVWLDEVTVKKINILGSDYKDELLKQIPPESLPREFGGICECEGGCSLSDAGPWNPGA